MKTFLSAALTVAAMAFGANGAWAAACTGITVGGATTDDATFRGVSSNECVISGEGNGGNTDGAILDATFQGEGNFVRIGKLGEDPDPAFASFNFVLTATGATPNSTEGTWTLTWTGGPGTLDLVLAVHASNRSGLFLFDDQFLAADSDGSGTWEINWLNNGGQIPGFSNMTVWARLGTEFPPGQVPEPAGLALLGLGALGLAFARKRRKG